MKLVYSESVDKLKQEWKAFLQEVDNAEEYYEELLPGTYVAMINGSCGIIDGQKMGSKIWIQLTERGPGGGILSHPYLLDLTQELLLVLSKDEYVNYLEKGQRRNSMVEPVFTDEKTQVTSPVRPSGTRHGFCSSVLK